MEEFKLTERDRFESWLNAKGLSERSIKEYLYYFNRFGGADNFNQNFVDDFVGEIGHGLPVRAFISNYKAFLMRQQPENTQIPRIEVIRMTGRKKKKLPDFVTEEEMLDMEKHFTNERNKIMLMLTFYGGLRAQGLLGIKPVDIDWKEWNKDQTKPAKLKVTEKGEKERIVFVPSFLMQRLKNWILSDRRTADPNTPLWRIKYDTWENLVTRDGRKALDRRVTPHMLRHGCATWLKKLGWDLQEIAEYLGHDSIATAEIYTHLDKTDLQNKYQELFNSSAQSENILSSST